MRLIMNNVERSTEDDAQIRKLMAAGFKPLGEAVREEKAEEKPELEKMKVDELRAMAKERGIEGAASLNKEELLAVLKG